MKFWLARFIPSSFSPPARAFLALIFAFHLGFSLFFVAAIPRDGGPDEGAHFLYVRQLAVEHALPVLTDPRQTRDSRTGAIAQHPPLTYLTGVPIYLLARPFGEAFAARFLRLEAVLWGVGTLFFFFRLLCENFPHRTSQNLAALALAALLPHFLLLSSVWNNDGLLIFLTSVFLWRFLPLVCRPAPSKASDSETATIETAAPKSQSWREWAVLGALWGFLLLTKATALLYIAPVFLLLGWQTLRRERPLSQSLVQLAAFTAPGLLIGGWWFARFYFMIGRIQPIPDLGYAGLLLRSPLDLLFHPDAPALMGRFIAGAMRSIWGQVDWSYSPPQRDAMNGGYEFWPSLWGPTLPGQPGLFLLTLSLYRVVVVVTAISALGWVFRAAKHQIEAPHRVLALFFGLLYAALGYYTLFKHPGFFEGGRYLLPALPATAVLWVSGLTIWLAPARQKWLAPAIFAFFVLWDIGCAVNLTQVLVPLYAPK